MTTLKSDFLRTLSERGFIHQCTDLEGLDARLAAGPISAYIGFDCTADSLHVGSLLPIMMLRWLQKTGHQPIVLMGGGTTKIGDPSGKDEARRLLTDEQIAANKTGIQRIFSRYLDFGAGTTDAVMVDNAEWLDRLGYIEVLRAIGPHFTINRMMTFDSVKLRLEREQPLTFLEFNYMILQAYDFTELFRDRKCILQMGGSDQWGNIVNGVELGRRRMAAELFGLTTPLLTTSSGAKMGKTAAGAVWMTADKMGPYDFWQYWRNAEDADVGRFLKLYTELPMDEIRRLEALQGAEINAAKKILADEVTKLAHGAEAAHAAAETAQRTFEQGQAAEGLPTVAVTADQAAAGVAVVELLVSAGLAASKGEARRLIKGGGIQLNDAKVTDEGATVTAADLTNDGAAKLTAGKKRHALVRAEG
ncbi:MAG TPA: tyrosine--tRNA ligase [Azospirillaceae bacterium]|nr:tyrosine--tRNA ligase [Azospirillaceae bacterium]